MRAVLMLALGVLLAANAAEAQQGNPLPVPAEVRGRTTSNPAVYERESAFKKKYSDEKGRAEKAEADLARLRAQLEEKDKATMEPSGASSSSAAAGATGKKKKGSAGLLGLDSAALRMDAPVPVPAPKKGPSSAVNPAVIRTTPVDAEEARAALDQPLVFAVSPAALDLATNGRDSAVPLGSYVKARILTGVEANQVEAYPMLLQLDYAFVGPNKTRIDLSHCFMVAKAKANLSTERVMGETQQISCVRNNNEIVTRPAKGYIAGEDSTFGVTGELISHQGQVFLAAVLASLAKGVGEAVALSQTTTTVATGGVGGVATAQNITGDKMAYVAGKAASEPATLIANWYLKYAESLIPAIAVGSGRDVWIVLLDSVRVPELDITVAEGRE